MRRSKAELMRDHRARLRSAGLVKVECWIQPEERERLSRYVEGRLGGFCPVGRQREGASTAGVVPTPVRPETVGADEEPGPA